MRLHRLTVTAFGPFAATQEIDFDGLSGAGIFLLHGPTGAGKTSVLDAVCFALYGAVPGARQGPGTSLRSDHAPADTPTEVLLDLTVGGRRLEIRRRPAQPRPKSRGRGTTTERAQSRLREYDTEGAAWRPLSLSHQEIGEEITQLVGMSRDQFCQVVLLPQGDFARFLRADAEARARLLGRLFDTGRFAAVEDRLADRRRAAEGRVRTGDERLLAVAHRMEQAAGAAADGWPAPRQQPGDPGLADAVLEWAAVARAGAVERADIAALTLEVAERRQREARRALDTATEEERLQRRHEDTLRRRDALEARRPEHDELATRLDRAERAERVAPALRLRKDAAREQATTAGAQDRIRAELPPGLRDAGTETLAERERGLRQDLGGLDAARRAERRSEAITRERAALDRQARADDEILAEAEGWLTGWDALRHGHRERIAAAQDAATRAEHLAARHDDARRRLGAARERDRLAALGTDADDRLRTARDRAGRARETWLDLKERRLLGIAAELAAALAPGRPCAVCGSEAHPDPARPDGGSVTAAQEDSAYAYYTRADAARTTAERELAVLTESLTTARAQARATPPRPADAPVPVTEATASPDAHTAAAGRPAGGGPPLGHDGPDDRTGAEGSGLRSGTAAGASGTVPGATVPATVLPDGPLAGGLSAGRSTYDGDWLAEDAAPGDRAPAPPASGDAESSGSVSCVDGPSAGHDAPVRGGAEGCAGLSGGGDGAEDRPGATDDGRRPGVVGGGSRTAVTVAGATAVSEGAVGRAGASVGDVVVPCGASAGPCARDGDGGGSEGRPGVVDDGRRTAVTVAGATAVPEGAEHRAEASAGGVAGPGGPSAGHGPHDPGGPEGDAGRGFAEPRGNGRADDGRAADRAGVADAGADGTRYDAGHDRASVPSGHGGTVGPVVPGARGAGGPGHPAAADGGAPLNGGAAVPRARGGAEEHDPTVAELEELVARLAEELRRAQRLASGAHAAREALDRAEREHRERLEARQEAERRAAARTSLREALDQEQALLLAELAPFAGDAGGVAARAGVLERRVRLLAGAVAAVREADTAAHRLKEADDRLADAAFRAGFDTPEAAAGALLPDAVLRDLRVRADAWRTEAAAVADRLAEPETRAAALRPPADTEAALVAHDTAERALRGAVSALGAARERRAELVRLSALAVAEVRDLGPLREEYDRVARLAGLAAGTSADNERRMRLESYVLAARLEQVAAAASVRLQRMSSGRYTLVHSDARAGGKRSGLGLHVVDSWTGGERDTATLSGGETFFASLALALGLADVVAEEAGGVRLDTLFVDEGFGSLDEQTLDEVIDVLDALRERDRCVGIVSHVADLRRRIPTRLEVVKERHGSAVRLHTAPLGG